ncbi:MAG: sigma 54-interacting transcriptional regulator [Terracidiphilus sp.]
MPIQGVFFRHRKQSARMEIGEVAALPELLGNHSLPGVLVLCADSLSLLAEFPALFVDRHQKDARKGLSQVLLGHGPRLPYIGAAFHSIRRLKQSVGALLENAAKRNEYGIYIVGVSSALFAEAWKNAEQGDAQVELEESQPGIARLLKTLPGESEVARGYWGESSAYHLVRQYILYAARNQNEVLIVGETGTGKGIVAREIHKKQHGDKPFVTVNCAAIPFDLFESEIFGYEPGAFTSALKRGKIGHWELAADGTLFLDEIGDLHPKHQAKILNALHDKTIRRLGGSIEIPVPARVIAATNRNLKSMVEEGRFRQDLFFRLSGFVIRTPVLRDNPDDIPIIAQRLWAKIANSAARLPGDILSDLRKHRWPGNVRELRSVLTTLNSFFGKEGLTREQLNWVFQYYGYWAGYQPDEPWKEDRGMLRLDCIKRIHAADEAIHRCEMALKPLAEGRRLTPGERDLLGYIQAEMHSQLEHRLDFGTHETYGAIERVEQSLGALLAIPPRKSADLSAHFHTALEPAIKQAVDRLFIEMENLREMAASR